MHYDLYDYKRRPGDKLVGTFICCPCCEDTKDGPVLSSGCNVSKNWSGGPKK